MRRFTTVVAAASLLSLAACGGKTDESGRAAGITPVSAIAFVSVNLDPSVDQKRDLLGIARRFPGAGDSVRGEFDEARDGLLADLVEGTGLDFERDVEPWLGNEVALAVLPPADGGDPSAVAMVETDDAGQARAALDKAAQEGFEGSYQVIGDFVVIVDEDDAAAEQAALARVAAQAEKNDGGLAESEAFTGVVDELAGDRLVLGWVDARKAFDLAGDLSGFDFGPLAQFGSQATTMAFDLHAERSALVFQGVAANAAEAGGRQPELTRALPAATLAALTLFDVGTGVTDGIRALAGVDGDDLLDGFEEQTGIDLEGDILSWMGGELVVVVGPVAEGRSFPDAALVVEPTDRAGAEQGVARVRQALADQGLELDERVVAGASAYVVPQPLVEGVQPAMGLFSDRFVLATSPTYLEALAGGSASTLADTDAYSDVVGDQSGDGTTMQLVVLIDPVREAIEQVVLDDPDDRATYEADVKPNLEPLSAFGVVARQDGDLGRVSVRLTFD
ncbi:MAG: DUF3352 domain-containing protein [Acidimicrobiales bacterium]